MDEDTSYQEAVDFVHSLGESVWKLGLERFKALCERLGNPQDRVKAIHVSGTNGKGSVTAMLAAMLRADGYRVGAYYSPFVYDIRERFQLDGEMISRSDFTHLVNEIRPHAAALAETEHGHPTEFEMKTAVGLLYFAENGADFMVLEVGLGGRLDATNVVKPLVSVITNVSMDHTDRLGPTIGEIAFEKAGIVKHETPCVTAAQSVEALDVIRRVCDERNAPLWHVHPTYREPWGFAVEVVDWKYQAAPVDMETGAFGDSFSYLGVMRRYESVKVGMRGRFQLLNAATSIAALEALATRGFDISEKGIRDGLASAYVPGRLEVLSATPQVVVDGAHNAGAAEALAADIRTGFRYRRLILVLGMVKGHSPADVAARLGPLADICIATSPRGPRSQPSALIAEALSGFCAEVSIVEPVEDAVRYAVSLAGDDDLVLISGSFYTIGEVPKGALRQSRDV